jgi:hypothetical protein
MKVTTKEGFEIDPNSVNDLYDKMVMHDSFELNIKGGHILKVVRVPTGLLYINMYNGRLDQTYVRFYS